MARPLQAHAPHVQSNVFPSDSLGAEDAATLRRAAANFQVLKLNARSVELIARPAKARELRTRLCDQLSHISKGKAGFEGVMVMASHLEPRRVVVVTLWQTRRDAMEAQWEMDPALSGIMEELVDVCARVQTYETWVPAPREVTVHSKHLQVC